MLLENRKKQFKAFTVEAAQARNRPSPLGACDARAFGPTADGQAAKPARRRAPLGPYLAHSPAAVPSRPSPTIRIERPSALFAETKTPATMRRPQTLGSFPLSVFSLHKTAAAMEPGKEATAPPPAPSPARVLPCVGARRRRAAWRWCPFGARAWRSNPSPRAAAPICAGEPVLC